MTQDHTGSPHTSWYTYLIHNNRLGGFWSSTSVWRVLMYDCMTAAPQEYSTTSYNVKLEYNIKVQLGLITILTVYGTDIKLYTYIHGCILGCSMEAWPEDLFEVQNSLITILMVQKSHCILYINGCNSGVTRLHENRMCYCTVKYRMV